MNYDFILQTLRSGRELIQSGWCQGAPARDPYGNGVSALSEEACEWCASGALGKVLSGPAAGYTSYFHRQLREKIEPVLRQYILSENLSYDRDYMNSNSRPEVGNLIDWNDHSTQTKEGVLKGFDLLIAHFEGLKNECTESTGKSSIAG